MALAPRDWPKCLPPEPTDKPKCGLCHDFSFEPGSTAEGNWRERSVLKEYYWMWELYGRHCQFCNVVREAFWHIAEKLGYARYILLEDFRDLEVSLFFGKGAAILYVAPPPRPRALVRRWTHQQYYLALAHKAYSRPWSYIPAVESNPGSVQKAAATIMTWLHQCTHEHHSDRCQSLCGEFVPTRLIRIDPVSRKLSLVQSRGIPVQYTALSYCWGGNQQKATKRRNLRQRLNGYGFDGIPTLLGDAIQLTTACKIEYIWIDAICIVQDDNNDRNRELGQMADIYYHAAFTISAAHARNVQQGLIPAERDWVPMSNQFTMNSTPSILVKHVTQHSPVGLLLSDETTWPAFDRCWTLQERLMSTRVVHFTPDELVWECATSVTCECISIPKVRDWNSIKWCFDRVSKDEPSGHDCNRFWQNLVTAYTHRHLKRDSDRLVAIGGLAKRCSQQSGGRLGSYLAGIWKKDIESLYGISWWADAATNRGRPLKWIAPSWSWASLKSGIEYPGTNPDLCRWHAHVDSVDCFPRSPKNPYGQVRSGELVLTAPRLNVVMNGDSLTEGLIASMAANGGIAALDCEWYWDVSLTNADSEVADGDRLVLVLLWSSWPKQSLPPYFTLMILKPHCRHVATWTRVGVAYHGLREGHREETRKLERWIESLNSETFSIV